MLTDTRTLCPYCGTGCGVIIESRDGRIVGVRGDPTHPTNRGRLCRKGANLAATVGCSGRLLYPELRERRSPLPEARRHHRLSWQAALALAAERFAQAINTYGRKSIGFYLSGQLLTEEYYVFNKLARALIGTNNIDSNSRLCMSSAVAGYKAVLGADSMPCCYEDLEQADLFLIAGANPAWAHPILYGRIAEARGKAPHKKMIVVDPRQSATATDADLHLAIRPGSDTVLYSGMLRILIDEGRVNRAYIEKYTEGFTQLADSIAELTPTRTAQLCGVSVTDLITATHWFAESPAPLSLWCQGLNQSAHGTANNVALLHLHLATGKLGHPGMGPLSLTGQPNAMGGREVGAMANLLSAHRDLTSAADRKELAKLWGVAALPQEPGLTAVELFEAAADGQIKALWIACTNPAHSLPDQNMVRRALERCDFVVLQDAFADSETTRYADLLLPAATWGEKDGTMTNSERRIGRVRAALTPPFMARPDWLIARDFAQALGDRLGRGEEARRLFAFNEPSEVFSEHARTTKGRDLDFHALDYELIEEEGSVTWPRPRRDERGEQRLYADARFATPSNRARFVALTETLQQALTAETPNSRYPFSLLSGRMRDQWHGMSRSGRVPGLQNFDPAPRLQLNRKDMEMLGLTENDWVKVSSARAHSQWQVSANDGIAPGQAWLPMHWGELATGTPGVNLLALAALDPHAKQPELKHLAVRIEKLAPWPHRLLAIRAAPNGMQGREQLLRWRAAVRRILPMSGDDNAVSVLIRGESRPLLRIEWSSRQAHWLNTTGADECERFVNWLQPLAAALEMPWIEALTYDDPKLGVMKRAWLEEGELVGLVFVNETSTVDELMERLLRQEETQSLRKRLFMPELMKNSQHEDRVICHCLNVRERQLREAIASGADLATLRKQSGAGSGCGGCLPEIKKMLVEAAITAK